MVLFVVLFVAALAYVVTVLIMAPPQGEPWNRSKEFDGDVDAVVMWVDCVDEKWVRQRNDALVQAGRQVNTLRHPTHADQEFEIRYCLRQLFKHTPWFRKIFIVTVRPQSPDTVLDKLSKEDRVKCVIVHHDEFIPYGILPTYNALTIQQHIHNIPGLAEHFVLFDDDFMVMTDVPKADFFTGEGKPVTRRDHKSTLVCRLLKPVWPITKHCLGIHTRMTFHTMSFLDTHRSPSISTHSPRAMTKSLFQEVHDTVLDGVTLNESKFREEDDVQVITLVENYGLLHNKVVLDDRDQTLFSEVITSDVVEKAKSYKYCCINSLNVNDPNQVRLFELMLSTA